MKETDRERSQRIISQLRSEYPGKRCLDMYGDGMHIVCEVEPVDLHPEYDRAIEVIINSKPHKHLKMTQRYKVLAGVLVLHDNNKIITLNQGEEYVVKPGHIHWAMSKEDEAAWVEIYSKPGWTKEDHILVK